jgi:hypothetical protein
LNDTVIKKIQLTNPSQKRISYGVTIEGSADFSIHENNVQIDAGGKAEFPVSYFARITKPVQARISFKANTDGANQGAPIVFDLLSKVVGRKSIDREEINDVKLYEVAQRILNVKNPFKIDAEFTISLEHLPNKRQAKKLEMYQ